MSAQKWTDLGFIDPFPTVFNSRNFLFLAQDLRRVDSTPDDGEVIKTLRIPLDEAVAMVNRGDISHGASCVALLKVQMMLGDR